MCECLEYEDGTMILCEVCAETFRGQEATIVELRAAVDQALCDMTSHDSDVPDCLSVCPATRQQLINVSLDLDWLKRPLPDV